MARIIIPVILIILYSGVIFCQESEGRRKIAKLQRLKGTNGVMELKTMRIGY